MIFRSKPHVIQAFRFDGWGTKLPEWFRKAQERGAAFVTMNSKEQHITVSAKHGMHRAFLNEWVCMNSSGTLFVLSNEEMQRGFTTGESNGSDLYDGS